MIIVRIDLDQQPIPLDSKLWCVILFPLIISCIADADVINGYRHLWGGGHAVWQSPFIRELDDSHVGHVLANGSTFCL